MIDRQTLNAVIEAARETSENYYACQDYEGDIVGEAFIIFVNKLERVAKEGESNPIQ